MIVLTPTTTPGASLKVQLRGLNLPINSAPFRDKINRSAIFKSALFKSVVIFGKYINVDNLIKVQVWVDFLCRSL